MKKCVIMSQSDFDWLQSEVQSAHKRAVSTAEAYPCYASVRVVGHLETAMKILEDDEDEEKDEFLE